jgi:hypothetical protein
MLLQFRWIFSMLHDSRNNDDGGQEKDQSVVNTPSTSYNEHIKLRTHFDNSQLPSMLSLTNVKTSSIPPIPPQSLPPPPPLPPQQQRIQTQVQQQKQAQQLQSTPMKSSQIYSPTNPPPNSQPASNTKLATFLRSGSAFPILVLTHNRPKLLEKTLTSLLKVRGVHRDRIFIAQDGHDPKVLSVIRKFGLKVDIHENPRVNGPPWKVGAVKIARHYRWSLSRMFQVFDPETPATIVVEDDLLFAPDFLEYFHAVAPILDNDPTLWAASSWNDNGFDYLVKDPKEIKRTGFFPGLGWCMTRKLWNELGTKWPQEHWDHWLRQPAQHKGREVLIPAMPRVYHNGVKGTFMDQQTHNKYFARIATNRDEKVSWNIPWDYGGHSRTMDPYVAKAGNKIYTSRITQLIQNGDTKHVHGINELRENDGSANNDGKVMIMWINVNVNPRGGMANDFKPIANFFGIWHEARRGAHRGVHELWVHGARDQLLIVNVHPSVGPGGFHELKPNTARIFNPGSFRGIAPLKKGVKGLVNGNVVGFP